MKGLVIELLWHSIVHSSQDILSSTDISVWKAKRTRSLQSNKECFAPTAWTTWTGTAVLPEEFAVTAPYLNVQYNTIISCTVFSYSGQMWCRVYLQDGVCRLNLRCEILLLEILGNVITFSRRKKLVDLRFDWHTWTNVGLFSSALGQYLHKSYWPDLAAEDGWLPTVAWHPWYIINLPVFCSHFDRSMAFLALERWWKTRQNLSKFSRMVLMVSCKFHAFCGFLGAQKADTVLILYYIIMLVWQVIW